MIRIAALNDSSSDSDDANDDADIVGSKLTKEAVENAAYSLYHKGLSYERASSFDKAIHSFEELLNNEFITKPVILSDTTQLNQSDILKYSALKNLAKLYSNQNRNKEAIEALLQAFEIDSTDVSVCYRLGVLAKKLDKYVLACRAFEKGLELSPDHWPCLDNLLTLFYALNNYEACLCYIAKALLRDCGYVKGLVLRKAILREQPCLEREYSAAFSQCDMNEVRECTECLLEADEAKVMRVARDIRETIKRQCKPKPAQSVYLDLQELTWAAVGKRLVELYAYIEEKSPDLNHFSPVVMNTKCDVTDKDITSSIPEVYVDVVGMSDEECNDILPSIESSIDPSIEPSIDIHVDCESSQKTSSVPALSSSDDTLTDAGYKTTGGGCSITCSSASQSSLESQPDGEVAMVVDDILATLEVDTGDMAKFSSTSIAKDIIEGILMSVVGGADEQVGDTEQIVGDTEQQLGGAEEQLGDTVWQEGDTERHEGDIEQQEGDIEQQEGDTEKQVSDTEQQVGDTKQQVGVTEPQVSDTEKQVGDIEKQVGDTEQQVGDTGQQGSDTGQQVGDSEQQVGDTEQQVGDTEQQLGDTEQQVGDTEQQVVGNSSTHQLDSVVIDVVEKLVTKVVESLADVKVTDDHMYAIASNSSVQVEQEKTKRERFNLQAEKKRRSARVKLPTSKNRAVEKESRDKTNHITELKSLISDILSNEALAEHAYHISNSFAMETQLDSITNPFPSTSAMAPIGFEDEASDVKQFLARLECNRGVVNLMKEWLYHLCEKRAYNWYSDLVRAYVDVYVLFRPCHRRPNILSSDRVETDALLALLWMELKLDMVTSAENIKLELGLAFVKEFTYWEMIIGSKAKLPNICTEFSIRYYYMAARYYIGLGQSVNAINVFKNLLAYMEACDDTDVSVSLNNNLSKIVLTKEKVDNEVKLLERTQSLNELNTVYSSSDYTKVLSLLKPTFTTDLSQRYSDSRYSQLNLLLNTVEKIEGMEDSVQWLADCLHELVHHADNSRKGNWAQLIVRNLDLLNSRITIQSSTAMSRTCIVKCCLTIIRVNVSALEAEKEMPVESVLPWILMSKLVELQQTVEVIGSPSGEMPRSLQILEAGHKLLSKYSLCTSSEGILLQFALRKFMDQLSDAEGCNRPQIEQCINQCVYCLYGHPSKKIKAKHLKDHSCPSVPITWSAAQQLFNYYRPKTVPNFDSFKSSTISADLEQLFKKLVSIVPAAFLPDPAVSHTIDSFLVETATVEEVAELSPPPCSSLCSEAYYLLADYYFKNKEPLKAIKHYVLDLHYRPHRFDSWAGMALAKSSKLESRLGLMERQSYDGAFQKLAVSTVQSFTRALQLNRDNVKLWIEFACSAYQLHSFASRAMKTKKSELSPSELSVFTELSEDMLGKSKHCYIQASLCKSEEFEEEWLHHYMLGKIAEKSDEEPSVYLNHYVKAGKCLNEEGAQYPPKISYMYSPPYLAVEALEMYYRVHASILKSLQRTQSQLHYVLYTEVVGEMKKSPFAAAQMPSPQTPVGRKRKTTIDTTEKSHVLKARRSDTELGIAALAPKVATRRQEKLRLDAEIISEVLEDMISKLEASEHSCQPANSISSSSQSANYKEADIVTVDSSPGSAAEDSSVLMKDVKVLLTDVVTEVVNGCPLVLYSSPQSMPRLSLSCLDTPTPSTCLISKMDVDSPQIPDSQHAVTGTEDINVTPLAVSFSTDLFTSRVDPVKAPPAQDVRSPMKHKLKEFPNIDLCSSADEEDNVLIEAISRQCMSGILDQLERPSQSSHPRSLPHSTSHSSPHSPSNTTDLVLTEAAGTSGAPSKSNSVTAWHSTIVCNTDSIAYTAGTSSALPRSPTLDFPATPSTCPKQEEENGAIDLYETKPVPDVDSSDSSRSFSGLVQSEATASFLSSRPQSVEPSPSDVGMDVTPTMAAESNTGMTAVSIAHSSISKDEHCSTVSCLSDSAAANTKTYTTSCAATNALTSATSCITAERQKITTSCAATDTQTTTTSCAATDTQTSTTSCAATDTQTTTTSCAATDTPTPTTSCAATDTQTFANSSTNISMSRESSTKKSSADVPKVLSRDELIEACISALKLCVQRYPLHYKSYFRLAKTYLHDSQRKDLDKVQDLLLGNTAKKRDDRFVPQGLFQDRKHNNFFNGVWRNPVEEIERAGSFGAHLYKTIYLLLQFLHEKRDYHLLYQLHTQLQRTPDQERKFLKDADRLQLSSKAMEFAIHSLYKTIGADSSSKNAEKSSKGEYNYAAALHQAYKWFTYCNRSSICVPNAQVLLMKAYRSYKATADLDFDASKKLAVTEAKEFCQQMFSTRSKDKSKLSSSDTKLNTGESSRVSGGTASPSTVKAGRDTAAAPLPPVRGSFHSFTCDKTKKVKQTSQSAEGPTVLTTSEGKLFAPITDIPSSSWLNKAKDGTKALASMFTKTKVP